jgi:hypothetical protein
MIFLGITALVLAVLVYAYVQLRAAYGWRTLAKIFGVTVPFFFLKEFLQSRNLLLHHYYHANHVIWVELLGVPPFVVLGHAFVMLMTWQLAVVHMHRLGLARHPAVFVTLVWYFTSAFSMLMENTGVVGGWWSWSMPSWWFYPEMFGAPLVGLPWERPITAAWGYFISTTWFVFLAVDLPRKWTPSRVVALLVGLLAMLQLARVTLFMSFWQAAVMPFAPLVSAWMGSSAPTSGRWMLLPVSSDLLREQPARARGAVGAGLLAMVAVCVLQIGVLHQWLALVSLFPIGAFTLGMWRRWPPWIDCLVSLAVILLGFWLNIGNFILAGWLVLRFSIVLGLTLLLLRWRHRRSDAVAAVPAGLA